MARTMFFETSCACSIAERPFLIGASVTSPTAKMFLYAASAICNVGSIFTCPDEEIEEGDIAAIRLEFGFWPTHLIYIIMSH